VGCDTDRKVAGSFLVGSLKFVVDFILPAGLKLYHLKVSIICNTGSLDLLGQYGRLLVLDSNRFITCRKNPVTSCLGRKQSLPVHRIVQNTGKHCCYMKYKI